MSWLAALAERLGFHSAEPRHRLQALRFRNLIGNVRRLAELGDDAKEKLAGGWVVDRSYIATFAQRSLELAEEVLFDSSVLSPTVAPRYLALDELRSSVESSLSERVVSRRAAPLIVPLREADRVEPSLVSDGARVLAEAARLGVPVPDGFVVTEAVLDQVLAYNDQTALPAGSAPESGAEAPAPAPERLALPGAVREAIAAAALEIRQHGHVQLVASGDGWSGEGTTASVVEAQSVAAAYARLVSRWLASARPSASRPQGRGPSPRPSLICLRDESALERGVLLSSDPDRPLQARLVVSTGEREVAYLLERYPEDGPPFAGAPDAYQPLIQMAVALERLAGRTAGGLVEEERVRFRRAAHGDRRVHERRRAPRTAHRGGPEPSRGAHPGHGTASGRRRCRGAHSARSSGRGPLTAWTILPWP